MQLFLEKHEDLTFFGKRRPVVTCAVQGHTLSFCFCLAPCWGSVDAKEVWQSASAVSRALGSSSVSHPLHTLLKVSNAVNKSDKLPRGRFIGLVIRLICGCQMEAGYVLCFQDTKYTSASYFVLYKILFLPLEIP